MPFTVVTEILAGKFKTQNAIQNGAIPIRRESVPDYMKLPWFCLWNVPLTWVITFDTNKLFPHLNDWMNKVYQYRSDYCIFSTTLCFDTVYYAKPITSQTTKIYRTKFSNDLWPTIEAFSMHWIVNALFNIF